MREGKRSHLPVYVDGTCNGLQHMAALLRDRTLAQYTNLLKSNSKQDTYTWILSAVKEKIIAVAADLSAPHQELADWIGSLQRQIGGIHRRLPSLTGDFRISRRMMNKTPHRLL